MYFLPPPPPPEQKQCFTVPRIGSPNTRLLQPILPLARFVLHLPLAPYLTLPLHVHVPPSLAQWRPVDSLSWVVSPSCLVAEMPIFCLSSADSPSACWIF